ncbi:glutamine-hydrolyzing carbamoyl-phosphate synthase small subunit [Croceimicrobium hydrocarbonivorans]|uniref:Carbamoyl phosphate synthase small chain n=1 Tax=Croceimicrobium hydrocarbonivorans TaxID=2761580 RepID=A0A7H0VCB6_9FLAO|nr:glutamine-hydrolyzing carbamoyl-phosphate synthase small subunit [Croceimicrobium hydrocarbonivorans]QNR23364.1 glutamine-hydrolyzing carbamoyl-phosphate synthase small subunit [Croceimicrobium hydrocarbonivorans]
MANFTRKKAVVVLQDGTTFWGRSVGLEGSSTGEICFNTGMTGYQEIFTDPSYYGQLMVTTNAHIGNYGVKDDEVESDSIKIAGLICKNFSFDHSRVGANNSLLKYFEENGKLVISDVDTRALVRHIRSKGAMNAIISTETDDLEALKALLNEVPSMEGLELSSKVATTEAYYFGDENATYKLAVLDLGVKRNILRHFANRGCYMKVFPMDTSLEEMKAWAPDGLFISNGPGDPAAMQNTVSIVNDMVNSGYPVFGICLGHQLIAISQGLNTYKMHQGHRGINHPVLNILTGKGEITTQNHGFVVSMDAVEEHAEIELTHRHLNDDGVQGIRLKNKPVSSVQYHPEAFPGPHDSEYLFDQFVEQLKQSKS